MFYKILIHRKQSVPLVITVVMLILSMLSGTVVTHADAQDVGIGEEIIVDSDGETDQGNSKETQKDTTTSDTQSQQNTSGSTNQQTYVPSSNEQERIDAVNALVNSRNSLIDAAMKNAGNLFGDKGSYYQVGVASVSPTQVKDICNSVERFKNSLNDSEVPDWMNNSASYNNTVSSTPHNITVDSSVSTLTDEENKVIAEALGGGEDVSNSSGIFKPDNANIAKNPNFFAINYTADTTPPFSKIFCGTLNDNYQSISVLPNGLSLLEWQKLSDSFKGTISKTDLIKGGLRVSDTWTGMFSQYTGYRSNAMNDFVTTTFIREYKIQKVERDILSEIDYTSDKRLWQVYKYVNDEWVEVGSPIETNNPEHEFRTSFHDEGQYKIVAKQWGVANKTSYAYYATCEYTFDTGSGTLIRYKESSIDNGNAGSICLGTQTGIEGWYDTNDVKYFNANNLGEIETADGITERVG